MCIDNVKMCMSVHNKLSVNEITFINIYVCTYQQLLTIRIVMVQIISNLKLACTESRACTILSRDPLKHKFFAFFSRAQLLPSRLACVLEILYKFAHELVQELLAHERDQFTISLANI